MNEQEREIYRLHGRLHGYMRRVDEAMTWIERGQQVMAAPCVSLSFGKDSTAMVHLLLTVLPEIPIFYVNCGEFDEWPDTARVKQEFMARFPCRLVELPGPSLMATYRAIGDFLTYSYQETAAVRQAKRDYNASLGHILDNAVKEHGCDGSFIGIRADESNGRLRLFRARGQLYFAKERGAWACHPLMKWSGRDVWAYIVQHDLPYNALYDIDPRGRQLARNGAMFGGAQQTYAGRAAYLGRLAYIRKMYPDWFNRFAVEFPQVRAYV